MFLSTSKARTAFQQLWLKNGPGGWGVERRAGDLRTHNCSGRFIFFVDVLALRGTSRKKVVSGLGDMVVTHHALHTTQQKTVCILAILPEAIYKTGPSA